MAVCRMVRLCCLTVTASGGVSKVTQELIEVGLDIKRACVASQGEMRDSRFSHTLVLSLSMHLRVFETWTVSPCYLPMLDAKKGRGVYQYTIVVVSVSGACLA